MVKRSLKLRKYDSQSKGIAERAVQTVEGEVRVMLLALESRLDAKIPVTHHVITWLVEHAADVLNKFAVGIDGRTAYERIKGKKYHGEMVEFGRRVMYKIPCKPEGGLMTERWVLGAWLGKRALSDEHVVAVDTGEVCVSSAVRLLPDSETPWNPKGADQAERREVEVEVIPAGLALDPGHPVQPRPQQPEGVPREIYIRREHLSKYGYTEGCMKCRSIREGFQITRGHSSLCRERICEQMKSEGNVADLEIADERKMVEQADPESKKARFVAPENTQEELRPNSGGPISSSTLWMPLGKRSGEEELDGTRPQKIMKEVPREPRRSQKRERDGDEAEDERPDRYQAVQEDNKDIVMEEVKSFNKVAFKMNQKVRDERMNRLLTNNPNTDACWNINAKKSMAEAVRYVEKWKPQILHLEPNSWSHMQAAIRLAQVQQQYDRDFVIVDLNGSLQFMECTSSKSDGQGQEYEAGGVQQLLWNRTSIPCTHEQLCSEGQTPALHQATDDDASPRRCAQGDWRSE